jgi:hypothetical protein
MGDLGEVEVAIGAVRNHHSARLEMELDAVERDRDDILPFGLRPTERAPWQMPRESRHVGKFPTQDGGETARFRRCS